MLNITLRVVDKEQNFKYLNVTMILSYSKKHSINVGQDVLFHQFHQKNQLYLYILDQGNLDSNVITYRSKYLSYFLKKILKIPYLWLGEEMNIFLFGTTE